MRTADRASDLRKRRLLFVFPDPWAGYSPTFLQLVAVARTLCDVEAVVLSRPASCGGSLPDYIEELPCIGLWGKLERRKHVGRYARTAFLFRTLAERIRDTRPDAIIATDNVGVLSVIGLHHNVHMLSLEVVTDGMWRAAIPWRKVRSVASQSQIRMHVLLGKHDVPRFLVPNSPISPPPACFPEKPARPARIVCSGSMIPEHGLATLIALARQAPQARFELTLAGRLPPSQTAQRQELEALAAAGNIHLDEAYRNRDAYVEYLSSFDLGLVLYDRRLPAVREFNYWTCPSGKMHAYFAAGLPVVGSSIPGLDAISEHGAGVQVDERSPDEVIGGIERVIADYSSYAAGARAAAQAYDFERSARAWLTHILATCPAPTLRNRDGRGRT